VEAGEPRVTGNLLGFSRDSASNRAAIRCQPLAAVSLGDGVLGLI